MNATIQNYGCDKLNFKSISKVRFDFICNYLNSQRITYLTLSDDWKTPGQIQTFCSRFNLADFVNLHSLALLSVLDEDIQPILSDLSQLEHLESLTIIYRSSTTLSLGPILNRLTSLRSLSVSHGDIFDHNVPLPLHNIKLLDAGKCRFLELRRLQYIVPSLSSLKIYLQASHQLQLLSSRCFWSSLERLDLTLNRKNFLFIYDIRQNNRDPFYKTDQCRSIRSFALFAFLSLVFRHP